MRNKPAVEAPISQFRLLLWLKLRLMMGAFRRSASTLIGTILIVALVLPLTIIGSIFIYYYDVNNPALAPFILRDVLTAAYLFWFLTPLLGFSMNESYDPTRLFSYPVRYQTIFTANVVGSTFEVSTLVFLPILITLLITTITSLASFVICLLLLTVFLLQTIALGQVVTLLLLGFLKSRRFRDIVAIVFPMIAVGRYYLQTNVTQGGGIAQSLKSPWWHIADFFPPGWTATAMTAARTGDWGKLLVCTLGLSLATMAIVACAAVVLKQLYSGERGTQLSVAKHHIATSRNEPKREQAPAKSGTFSGPVFAIAEKEFRYLIRDPTYKAMASSVLYIVIVIGISFSRIGNFGWLNTGGILHAALPIVASVFVLLSTMPLVLNIFGGEGPAITMLFSFPTKRYQMALGKNFAHGLIVFAMVLLTTAAAAFFMKTTVDISIAVLWSFMATLVILSAGNIVSVFFPTRLVVRGTGVSRGGMVRLGASRDPATGCAFGILYLLCGLAAMVAEVPAALAILLPGIGWIARIWYALTVPIGLAYAVGLYLLSIYLFTLYIPEHEQKIIAKLVPTD